MPKTRDKRSRTRVEELKTCGHALSAHDKEENYMIGEKIVCADCYFSAPGEKQVENLVGGTGHRGVKRY